MTLSIQGSFATLGMIKLCIECRYAEYHVTFIIILNVVMPIVTLHLLLYWTSLCWVSFLLNVILLNVLYWVLLCWMSFCWMSYTECCYAECHYAESHFKLIFMLNVLVPSVVMLSVVAPKRTPLKPSLKLLEFGRDKTHQLITNCPGFLPVKLLSSRGHCQKTFSVRDLRILILS